jgi:nucleoid-associated protein YgaU
MHHPGDTSDAEESDESDVPPVTPRERALAERVKALHTQILALKRDLARTEAALAAATKAPAPQQHDRTATKPADSNSGQPAKQPVPTAAPTTRKHTVTRGETLSSLARNYYGSLKYWPALRDANENVLKGSETLRPGMVLIIPPLEDLKP